MTAPGQAKPDLARQRCFNHEAREAAARCLRCRRFFCRECVTEHEGRLTCGACLRELAKPRTHRREILSQVGKGALVALGLLVGVVCFYIVGSWLLTQGNTYHQPQTVQKGEQPW
jgi:hypothetical protein